MSTPKIKIVNHITRDAPFNVAQATASTTRRKKLNAALNDVQAKAGDIVSQVHHDGQIEEARRSLAALKRAVDNAVQIANAGTIQA